MKNKKLLLSVAALAAEIAAFYSLNNVYCPLSASLYVAIVSCGAGLIVPSIALIVAALKYRDMVMLINALVTGAGTVVISSAYRKRGRRAGAETVLFLFLSQTVFIVFYEGQILYKLVYTAIIAVFYLVCLSAVRTIKYKKFIAKPSVGEAATLATLFVACGVGAILSFGENAYKATAFFAVLFAVRLYKSPTALFVAVAAALPQAVTSAKTDAFALFAAVFFASYALKDTYAPLMATAAVAADVALAYLFGFYADYGYIEALFVFVPAAVFSLLPESIFEDLTLKGYLGGDKISRRTIARLKSTLSGKLYDVADAFSEIDGALTALGTQTDFKKQAVKRMTETAIARSCEVCLNARVCPLNDGERCKKLVELALAKGRLTLVDLPKDYVDMCVNPNPLLYEINKLADACNEKVGKLGGAESVGRIISLLALGVKERLSDMAYELDLSVSEDIKAEKTIAEKLAYSGLKTFGVMVTGEEDKTVSLIADSYADADRIAAVLSEGLSLDLTVSAVEALRGDMRYVEMKRAPALNVAFGVGAVKKSGSDYSGDVHSLLKLDERRILVALSDGMGSGEQALNTSTAAIGLIEGLLKAGLKAETVFPIVNEMISVATEDNFSAVDIGVVDLDAGGCDFIKIGAPYGFILSEEGIRYVEGASLPIGILGELRPTTAHAGVNGGDMLVMLSDGVTDAFGSSSDFIEYLKCAPTRNPQALADDVIGEALKRTGGVAEDDMTCLCVRLSRRKREESAA